MVTLKETNNCVNYFVIEKNRIDFISDTLLSMNTSRHWTILCPSGIGIRVDAYKFPIEDRFFETFIEPKYDGIPKHNMFIIWTTKSSKGSCSNLLKSLINIFLVGVNILAAWKVKRPGK